MDALTLDQDLLASMPVNSNEPRFVAAEVFQDTLYEVGVSEDVALMAKSAFYALTLNSEENTEQKIQRIASRVSLSSCSKSMRSHARQRSTSNEERKKRRSIKTNISSIELASVKSDALGEEPDQQEVKSPRILNNRSLAKSVAPVLSENESKKPIAAAAAARVAEPQ
eukprot:CAMPEP_0170459708 /NCGR_PEP_ID=MMETSP0123-20130129/6304_1 /TAXON_ID=182087 /ORGANISM="Favella ehrenbergii, Strain Fehren 1" /LENGTH=167 /DNA_ID=CAMNT_0010724379 /DNA_START=2841 /DNA_END=3344 /DNA_ORIENTATION=-